MSVVVVRPHHSSPTPGGEVRVLLVDDHKIIRDGLSALLKAYPRFVVVGEADNGHHAIQLVPELNPDVVLMDISMPGLNGVDAAREIKLHAPQIRIIALSMHIERTVVKQMLQAGASGFLSKDCASKDLLTALESVMANRLYLSPDITSQVIEEFRFPGSPQTVQTPGIDLSPQDREMIQLLAEGKNTKEVADCLKLSPKTIDVYRRRLMNRLQIGSIAELTKFAIREGLTSLDA